MKRTVLFLLLIQLFLTGCWDNQEFEEAAFVQGVGLDKADNKINVIAEITKPSGGSEGGSSGQSGAQHIIFEKEADTLLEAFRGMIRTAKRRLDFTHTQIYIISEKLARETEFPLELDLIRRDTMFRLNSYLFISEKDPVEIFNTPTLYKSLTSNELASVIEQTKFITEYLPIFHYEFFRFLKDHHTKAYIPIISVKKSDGHQKVTEITGTAVIKNNRMVGKLNIKESAGLNWLLNQVKGGSVTVVFTDPKPSRLSIEVRHAETKIKPYLDGNQLKVNIHTKVEATLADNMSRQKVDRAFFKNAETKISSEVERLMYSSLKKLKKLETDITDFELNLRRNNPKEWKRVKGNWEQLYANADVNIDVDVNINHRGMINESFHFEQKRPSNNPYRFIKTFLGW